MGPTSQRVLSDLLFDVLCAVKLVDGRPLILLPHVWYREENPPPFERPADSVAGEGCREHGTIILGVPRVYMDGVERDKRKFCVQDLGANRCGCTDTPADVGASPRIVLNL